MLPCSGMSPWPCAPLARSRRGRAADQNLSSQRRQTLQNRAASRAARSRALRQPKSLKQSCQSDTRLPGE